MKTDTRWRTVWSFAQRPCEEQRLLHGVIVDIDPSIAALQARVFDTGNIVTAAIRHLEDRSEHVRDIVRHGGDAVRMECFIAPHTHQVVRMDVVVQPEMVDRHMALGSLVAEVSLIQLAMETWRDARVPDDPLQQPSPSSPPTCRSDRWKEDTYPLFDHQRASVAWMRRMERDAPVGLRYAGNLRITDMWFIDTEQQSFTKDPSWREAQLVGGVCCDGTGTGKTATALYHVLTSPPVSYPLWHASEHCVSAKGTLIVLPLNLVSQWQAELTKFARLDERTTVLWIVQGKDLKGVTMRTLLDADLVFTTFHFLRGSKPYAEMVERAIGRQKSRPFLSAWTRRAGREEPILEAVTWNRVVVDELHSTLESSRDLRQLKLLSYRMLWGLTATPDTNSEGAQHLYVLLQREKAHHPNLLTTLLSEAVRGTASSLTNPAPELRLVQLSDEARLEFHEMSETKTVEEVVKLCTFVEAVGDETVGDADDIEKLFLDERHREVALLRARVQGHAKAVQILERASQDLEVELASLADGCAQGDFLAEAQADAAREAAETSARDLERARRLHDTESKQLQRRLATTQLITRQLSALKSRSETCNICMVRECVAITPCAHLFCADCVKRHLDHVSTTCPTCRAPLETHMMTRLATNRVIHTKMTQMGELIAGLGANEPLILFVQWKAMVRGMKSFLKSLNVRVLLLDGNSAQRAITLQHFLQGGLLLLCLEDSFAGLHLPHARHVIFAHAIVGDRDKVRRLEQQAIARCVRHGQTSEVKVFSFVVADCEEETLWRQTHMEVDT